MTIVRRKAAACCGGPAPASPRDAASCCGASDQSPPGATPRWQSGVVDSGVGPVPRVSSKLTLRDRLGRWRVRWGVGRSRFGIAPGLYAVGRPTPQSPVLVTGNFKMSFDGVRAALAGRDAWILALDTRGINVWCAAGKGVFGTDELIRRAESVRLAEVVVHRRLIVPQLGATGVSAQAARERRGWFVKFGPVRAVDLPAYLDAGMKATPEMRRVRFGFVDRVTLAPVELANAAKYVVILALAFALLAGIGAGGYSLQRAQGAGLTGLVMLLAAWLAGAAVAPALLPWLPCRAFSLKGAWTGAAAGAVFLLAQAWGARVFDNWAEAAGWLALMIAGSSFLAMNFTGASTYTSLSGVRREMRVAVPLQVAGAVVGLGLWGLGRFV